MAAIVDMANAENGSGFEVDVEWVGFDRKDSTWEDLKIWDAAPQFVKSELRKLGLKRRVWYGITSWVPCGFRVCWAKTVLEWWDFFASYLVYVFILIYVYLVCHNRGLRQIYLLLGVLFEVNKGCPSSIDGTASLNAWACGWVWTKVLMIYFSVVSLVRQTRVEVNAFAF